MADLFEKRGVRQQTKVLSWRNETDEDWFFVILPQVGQRQNGITKAATGGRTEPYSEVGAIEDGAISY